jgi:hypothetical protein
MCARDGCNEIALLTRDHTWARPSVGERCQASFTSRRGRGSGARQGVFVDERAGTDRERTEAWTRVLGRGLFIKRACAVSEQGVILRGGREEVEDEREAGRALLLAPAKSACALQLEVWLEELLDRSVVLARSAFGDGERQAQIDVRASDVRVGGLRYE